VTDQQDDPLRGDSRDDQLKITLTGRDAEDARRLLAMIAAASVPGRGTSSTGLIQKARQILSYRRRRVQIFGLGMFGEPAWDMLLWLYVADSDQRTSVTALARRSGASKSTALRWIDYLADRGFIGREAHPTDARIAFVSLTDTGKAALDLFLSETLIPEN